MRFFCGKNPLRYVYGVILFPFSLLYWLIFQIKRTLTKKHKLIYSIAVGNIVAGGTGKSPIVMYLSEKISQTAIITRGYGSNFKGFAQLKHKGSLSDEVNMYLRNCDTPVICGKNRLEQIKRYNKILGNRILILDDGLQYFPLIPTMKICLLDSQCPFGNGFLLPAGILREPPHVLKKMDIILIKGTKHISEIEKIDIPKFHFNYKIKGIFNIKGVKTELKRSAAYTLTSIGNPLSFFKTVKELGFSIKRSFVFPDHHYYKKGDIDKLPKDLPILTTEKDIVKLTEYESRNIFFVKIGVKLENELEFLQLIRSNLGYYNN